MQTLFPLLVRIVVLLADAALLLISGSVLLTVVGLSVMVFDAGFSLWGWIFFLTITAICFALEVGGLYLAIRFYRKKRYLYSVLGSALPLGAFIVFQFVLSVLPY